MSRCAHPALWLLMLLLLLVACAWRQAETTADTTSPSDGELPTGDNLHPLGSAGASPAAILAQVGRGIEIYENAGCARCHRIGDEGAALGPDLTMVGARLDPEEMRRSILDPQTMLPGTTMPPQPLDGDRLDDLLRFLSVLR